MRLKRVLLAFLAWLLVACSGSDGTDQSKILNVMTHDSFAISEEVLQEFETEYDVTVSLQLAGEAGAALNQAILAKDNPSADVLFGVDNTFLSRAITADIFETYQSDMLEMIPDEYELDGSYRLLPVDFGDVCLNYDKAWFEEKELSPPSNLKDLLNEEYRGLTVVENPATSSPGLAFLLATIGYFGLDGEYTYLDYWRDLRANDVLVSDSWTDAYFGRFSATGEGSRPIVVSYASSPPAEVVFSETPMDEPPTSAVTTAGSCFRQIEFVGILKGTQHRELAESFIDFMLGKRFQEDIPLNMFVFPVNETASLPEVFSQWAEIATQPAVVDPDAIEENRERWIEAWTRTVLR